MSTIYSVIPLGVLRDTDLAELRMYLTQHGLEYPPDADGSRYPTQNEIEQVLRSIGGEVQLHSARSADGGKRWSQASLVRHSHSASGPTDEYVTLNIVGSPRDKDSPCRFYLAGGTESLNYAVLEQIGHVCGPLFCLTDGECDAVIFHRQWSNVSPPPSFAVDHRLHGRQATED